MTEWTVATTVADFKRIAAQKGSLAGDSPEAPNPSLSERSSERYWMASRTWGGAAAPRPVARGRKRESV